MSEREIIMMAVPSSPFAWTILPVWPAKQETHEHKRFDVLDSRSQSLLPHP